MAALRASIEGKKAIKTKGSQISQESPPELEYGSRPMHRTFEEMGVTVDGVSYGHFTGEAQFDVTGQVVQIDVECENFGGRPLTLDIEALVRERIQLRRKYGVAFLEDGASAVRSHNVQFVLFQALARLVGGAVR